MTAKQKVGLVHLKCLLGDALVCHYAFALARDADMVAVVPANGCFAYLADCCRMVPWIKQVIPIKVPEPFARELDWQVYRQAAALLRGQGISELVCFDFEHNTYLDRHQLFSGFDRIDTTSAVMINGYDRLGWQQKLRLSQAALQRHETLCRQFGLEHYVTVHNREPGWARGMEAGGSSNSGAEINNMRNYAITPLLDACATQLPHAWKVVRLGDASMSSVKRDGVLDITGMGLTLEDQAALLAGSRFFVGGQGGMMQLAHGLGVPVVTINMAHPCGFQGALNATTVAIEKRVMSQGRTLALHEVPLVHGGEASGRLINGLGYEIYENTADEIGSALRLMLRELDSRRSFVLDQQQQEHSMEAWLTRFVGGELPNLCRNPQKVLTAYEHRLEPYGNYFTYACFDRRKLHQPYKVALFGASALGAFVLGEFSARTRWSCTFYDSDANKAGTHLGGVPVKYRDELLKDDWDFIAICCSIDQGAIAAWLEQQGWLHGRDFIRFEDREDPTVFHGECLLWERFDCSAPLRLVLLGSDRETEYLYRRLSWRTAWTLQICGHPEGLEVDGPLPLCDPAGLGYADFFIITDLDEAQYWQQKLVAMGLVEGQHFIQRNAKTRVPFRCHFLNPNACEMARTRGWVDHERLMAQANYDA